MTNSNYSQLWRIVEGGVVDCFNNHPDYLTPKGKRSAQASIVKRVTGTVLSFAEHSARGRVKPAETDARAEFPEHQAAGVVPSTVGGWWFKRHPHCRIGAVRIKHRPGIGAITRNRLKARISMHRQLAQELGRGLRHG
jgi:hypothetical protein